MTVWRYLEIIQPSILTCFLEHAFKLLEKIEKRAYLGTVAWFWFTTLKAKSFDFFSCFSKGLLSNLLKQFYPNLKNKIKTPMLKWYYSKVKDPSIQIIYRNIFVNVFFYPPVFKIKSTPRNRCFILNFRQKFSLRDHSNSTGANFSPLCAQTYVF